MKIKASMPQGVRAMNYSIRPLMSQFVTHDVKHAVNGALSDQGAAAGSFAFER